MKRPQNWNQPCPNTACCHAAQKNQGNLRGIASYMTPSGKRRIFECTTCHVQFAETRGTVFFDLRTPEEKVIMALKMVLVRVSLTKIAFVLGVTEQTVLEWLERAAAQAEKITTALLRDWPVTAGQVEEMWSCVKRKVSTPSDGDPESPQEADDGRQWGWVRYAPQYRLILATVGGPRTDETALQLLQLTARIVLGIPAFFSDGFRPYVQALLACYHTITTFPRTGKRGAPQKPVTAPHPDLVYGQVVKKKRKGRLVQVVTRVVCGTERLATLGLTIRTTLLERLNLTFRQALAPLARKTLSFRKERRHLEQHTQFFQAFYTMARPHRSLRDQMTDTPQRFAQRWRPRTPAMAAGITDHVWTFRELLTAKCGHIP